MEVQKGLEHLLDGDAMLFIGAGFSLDAVNLRGERMKTGGQLAKHFAAESGLPDLTPLDEASEEFLAQQGAERLIFELQQEFTAQRVADHHLAIARLPWRRIYTSNYDNVMETAYSRNSRRLTPVVPGDRIKEVPRTATLCVHLNGFVDRLTVGALGSQFKLTDTSYVSESLLQSPWVVAFRQDLQVARAVFFVGYSGADLDIRRLLFDSSTLKDKTFFVLGSNPDAVTSRRAARFGTVIPLDAAGFADAATMMAASYSPRLPLERIGVSIERFRPPETIPPFSDRLVFDLFLYGELDSAHVWNDLHDGHAYYVERSLATQVLTRLSGAVSAIVVHSDLGNGKTALLEGVKCRAIDAGYDVYVVKARSDSLLEELAAVLALDSKLLLVIDNYPAWLDVLEYVGTNGRGRTSLVLGARSAVHDVLIDRLCALLGVPNVIEIAADRLSEDDLVWIAECFDQYGLWGERAAWNLDRKLHFLRGQCASEFHAVLLSVLESPQIRDRFRHVLDDIQAQRGYFEIVLTILVLTVLQYPTSVDTVLDIWGEAVLDSQFRRDAAIRELLSVEQGTVRLRSSVAAQFILQRITDAGTVTEVLTKMARVADVAAEASPLYWSMLKELMRFSSLQQVLPEHNRRASVIGYYENIKNLSTCKRNPHFWLQYAIASTILEDFERAERYFETAYSLAENRHDYDTHMIDNHFARFLLLRAISRDDVDACMSAFRDARRIINSQIRSERLHYPYRVAATYADFFQAFFEHLTPSQRVEIGRAAKFVADQIAKLSEVRRQQKYVVDCADAMESVVARSGLRSESSAN